jgi:hypothetical protein
MSMLSVILLPGVADAAELGRLFSTPSERLRLNQMRHAGGMVSIPAVVPERTSPAIPAGEPIRFNGFVKRSSGQRDAWVNGRHAGSDQALSRKLGSGNTMRIKVPDSRRKVRLKAGQVMDPLTGDVYEVYEPQKADHPPRVDK